MLIFYKNFSVTSKGFKQSSESEVDKHITLLLLSSHINYYSLNASLTEDFWSQDIVFSISVIILRRVFRAVN